MMDELLSNAAAALGLVSIVVSVFVAWRSLGKTNAEARKADADTYGVWTDINDRLRDELEAMRQQMRELRRRMEALETTDRDLTVRLQETERENRELKARVQSLEHENKVLREQLMRYEDSGVFKIPKRDDKET